MHSLSISIVFVSTFVFASATSVTTNPTETGGDALALITLEQSLILALKDHPALRLQESRLEAQQGTILTAGNRPNPILQAEVENILGSGPFQNTNSSEWTLGLTYTLERGNKRTLRKALSETENAVLLQQMGQWTRQLLFQTRSDFYALLIAQKRVEIRQEELVLAQQARDEIARMVSAARSSQVELTRAELQVQLQGHSLKQAEMEQSGAWNRLAANWGTYSSDRQLAMATIELKDAPDFQALLAKLPAHPSLEQFAQLTAQREASLRLEQSKSQADIDVFAGARYFHEGGGEAALTFGVEMPWMHFDKNQGGIRTAQAELKATRFEKELLLREMQNRLLSAHQALVQSRAEAISIEAQLIPAAVSTLKVTTDAYDQGRYSQMAVLEARKTIIELKEQYLHALEGYLSAHNQIWELTAEPQSQTR